MWLWLAISPDSDACEPSLARVASTAAPNRRSRNPVSHHPKRQSYPCKDTIVSVSLTCHIRSPSLPARTPGLPRRLDRHAGKENLDRSRRSRTSRSMTKATAIRFRTSPRPLVGFPHRPTDHQEGTTTMSTTTGTAAARSEGEKAVALYFRVSTKQQDVSRQIDGCSRLAADRFPDVPVLEYPEAGASAFHHSVFDRQASKRMIEDMLSGRLVGIVADTQDRLSRGKQAELWPSWSCATRTASPSSPSPRRGRSRRRVQPDPNLAGRDPRSQGERNQVASGEDAERRGQWAGLLAERHRPLRLLRRRREAPARPRAERQPAARPRSLRPVRERPVVDQGVTAFLSSETGRKWHRQNVREDILTNPAYIGRMRYDGEALDAKWESVVPLDVWEAVQYRLDGNVKPPYSVQPLERDPRLRMWRPAPLPPLPARPCVGLLRVPELRHHARQRVRRGVPRLRHRATAFALEQR